MSETKYNGKTTSFWDLIKSHNIEIPIIQRDYAQGRIDKNEIRTSFLSAIFNSIKESKRIRLDFIYGSIVNDSFQPLDGQQRLTTLFLLHWYAAMKESISVEMYFKYLTKFKYETRITSREFCESLIINKTIIDSETSDVSHKIIDSSWFFLSWKKDPTIDAMLRMIDDIHKTFFTIDDLWGKLTDDNCLIDFYHVDLDDIGLTDDLYIKMNARGKLLSFFENFKASFEKHIIDNRWENDVEFKSSFANKIDSEWTDLFWNNRRENSIDSAFMRFISAVGMINLPLIRYDDRINIIRALQDNPNSLKPEYFNKESFSYLCEVFHLYYKKQDFLPKIEFPLFQHSPIESIFTAITNEGTNASYTQKVLFFAQTEFIRLNDDLSEVFFGDWMRVIRNIISRGDVTKNGDRPAVIRSPEAFEGVINLVRELAAGCSNIYDYLALNQVRSTFAKEQVEEERIKAKLIINNPDSKRVIHDTEDTNLLQGRIEFAFHCIGHDSETTVLNINMLRKVEIVLKKYFNDESSINNNFRRAMLTIPDTSNNYEYYGYWWSFWNVVSANKRCLIDKYRELEYFIYGKYKGNEIYRDYFKKLVLQLFDKNLEELINDFIPPEDMANWQLKLIKEKEWLDTHSKSNYIAIPDDNTCCYLLKSMRPRDIEGCVKVE